MRHCRQHASPPPDLGFLLLVLFATSQASCGWRRGPLGTDGIKRKPTWKLILVDPVSAKVPFHSVPSLPSPLYTFGRERWICWVDHNHRRADGTNQSLAGTLWFRGRSYFRGLWTTHRIESVAPNQRDKDRNGTTSHGDIGFSTQQQQSAERQRSSCFRLLLSHKRLYQKHSGHQQSHQHKRCRTKCNTYPPTGGHRTGHSATAPGGAHWWGGRRFDRNNLFDVSSRNHSSRCLDMGSSPNHDDCPRTGGERCNQQTDSGSCYPLDVRRNNICQKTTRLDLWCYAPCWRGNNDRTSPHSERGRSGLLWGQVRANGGTAGGNHHCHGDRSQTSAGIRIKHNSEPKG